MCGSRIVDEAPSSASLSANGDKYQRNVTYLFDNKAVLSWVTLTIISEAHYDIEVVVAKMMCRFLMKLR